MQTQSSSCQVFTASHHRGLQWETSCSLTSITGHGTTSVNHCLQLTCNMETSPISPELGLLASTQLVGMLECALIGSAQSVTCSGTEPSRLILQQHASNRMEPSCLNETSSLQTLNGVSSINSQSAPCQSLCSGVIKTISQCAAIDAIDVCVAESIERTAGEAASWSLLTEPTGRDVCQLLYSEHKCLP